MSNMNPLKKFEGCLLDNWSHEDNCVKNSEGKIIAECSDGGIAQFIEISCNSHVALLEALKAIVQFNTPLPYGLLKQAREAIAHAEGRAP